MPPHIENGSHNGSETELPAVGAILEYTCEDDYFAYGANSDKLQTECQRDGKYSLQASNLTSCVRICEFYETYFNFYFPNHLLIYKFVFIK